MRSTLPLYQGTKTQVQSGEAKYARITHEWMVTAGNMIDAKPWNTVLLATRSPISVAAPS